jgi:putative oxidoreductase
MLAIGFLFHGLPKLTAAGHDGLVGMLTSIGVPLPGLTAWGVGVLEVFGALAILLGMYVTLASGLLIVEMLVAAFTVHLAHGFSFINITGMGEQGPVFGMPGVEVNLLYIAALVSLLLSGPGALSVGGRRES